MVLTNLCHACTLLYRLCTTTPGVWLHLATPCYDTPGSDVTFHPAVQKKKGDKKGVNDAVLEQERDQLANALERLADVQRELAEGQRSLMTGQHPCGSHVTSM